jgi:hypothetical protein
MRYVCAAVGCLRSGVLVWEPICAACGVRTLPEPPARPTGGAHVQGVLLVVLLTAAAGLLGLALGGYWLLGVLGAIGAIPAWWATRQARAQDRPTYAYWLAFGVTLVVMPLVAPVLLFALLLVGALMGSP